MVNRRPRDSWTGPCGIGLFSPERTPCWSTTLMPNTLPRMKLSPDEEVYLRHWMHDEVHYRDGTGRAKLLQRSHGVSPADLAALIAAAIPSPQDQATAGFGPPPAEPPAW